MKFTIIFAAFLAVSSAQYNPFKTQQSRFPPSPSTYRPPLVATIRPPPKVNRVQPASSDQAANTIRFDNDIGPDGSYNYAYETDNGISAQAQGTPRDFGGNPSLVGVVSQGSYSWTSPEGQPIVITYVADENGYQPSGDSIPTPHPIPEAILRAIEYNARNPQKL